MLYDANVIIYTVSVYLPSVNFQNVGFMVGRQGTTCVENMMIQLDASVFTDNFTINNTIPDPQYWIPMQFSKLYLDFCDC